MVATWENRPVTEEFLFNGLLPLATEQYNKWGYVCQQIVTNNATTSLRELLKTPTMERGRAGLALCVTTFQRTAQLMAALPVNLCITWALRKIVTWVIIDFNADDEVMDLMSRHFGLALSSGHVQFFRVKKPWKTWHAPLAKNTANANATILTTQGWAIDEIYRVSVDNDNILTREWVLDAIDVAVRQTDAV